MIDKSTRLNPFSCQYSAIIIMPPTGNRKWPKFAMCRNELFLQILSERLEKAVWTLLRLLTGKIIKVTMAWPFWAFCVNYNMFITCSTWFHMHHVWWGSQPKQICMPTFSHGRSATYWPQEIACFLFISMPLCTLFNMPQTLYVWLMSWPEPSHMSVFGNTFICPWLICSCMSTACQLIFNKALSTDKWHSFSYLPVDYKEHFKLSTDLRRVQLKNQTRHAPLMSFTNPNKVVLVPKANHFILQKN